MEIWAFNLRHLAAFAATVRLGSLSAAAQEISLTQPAVTQALAKLERLIGETMFERSQGGMIATDAARLFARRVEDALSHIASPRVTMAQMRALIELADAGSYAGASAVTGLSQPTLHRAVGDLAIALRRTLVERRGKGVAITLGGRRTLRSFRLARAELSAGLSEVYSLRGREVGRITIGAMPLCRARLLPAALMGFHREYPWVKIRVVEGSHAELIEPLRDGDIDLLLGALREVPLGDDVEQYRLFDDQPVVLARAGHPLARLDQVDIDALSAYSWTIPAHGTPLRTLWERMFSHNGVATPQVPIECGSVITIRQMLLDSDMLTMLSPDQALLELEAGWLIKIAAPTQMLRRTIGMTSRTGWRPTPAQARFVELLKSALS